MNDMTVVRNCNQMWCVMEGCNTAFDWVSGRIITGAVHNPHYYEWLRRTGGQQRETGDIPCGGVPTYWVLLSAFRVARIVPEFEPGPERMHLQGQPDQGWLVHCSPDQVQCLALSQPAQASFQVWRSLMPREMSLSAEPALAVTARALSERDAPLLPAGQVLQEAANSTWNLAQFDLASRSSWHQRLGRRASHWLHDAAWRPARYGLAALLALQVLGLQLWAWQEKRGLAQREQAVADVLTGTFTHVKLVIDPLRQMERETALLAQSRGQASAADLTRMLEALASVAGGVPKSLDYKPAELSLSGWQPPQSGDWKDSLSRQGFRLDAAGERWVMRPNTEGAAR